MRLELEKILQRVQKPGRYVGGEPGSIVKDKSRVEMRFAFCFPDLYEVGMSHLGMKILYALFNEREDMWCERVFAPDVDMVEQMQAEQIPLYGLESFDPISSFDFIGFTLQYEMSYTTVLQMLRLAGVPILAQERFSLAPLVVAGGPCACNAEPLADFIDLFMLGEGEEVSMELFDLYKQAKREGLAKKDFLRRAAQIPGIYVPSLYEVGYRGDGTIDQITAREGAPLPVTKRIIQDLDKVFFPKEFVVPFIGTVHDRAMLEVLRGCIRGCRFCQAGYIYRPFREKHHDTLNQNGRDLCASTGYDEISLTSLSTSDYSELASLMEELLPWTEQEKVNLSLPSLRVDNFSPQLLEQIAKVRKSGLTFAPEAGTQRMRDVINKNVTEQEVMDTCRIAFEGGYTAVKLYFMIGLPTETEEDLEGIVDLAQKVVDLYYHLPERPKGKGVTVTISCACFIPKPFTPFAFEPQDTLEQLQKKQEFLLSCVKKRSKKIHLNWHDASTSLVEAVLARGDRRLGRVLQRMQEQGCYLESWDEHFDLSLWQKTMAACGLTPDFYANRLRPYEEVLPWDHLDYGISKAFLISQNRLAHQNRTTPPCRMRCSGCGANKLLGGACFDYGSGVL